MCFDKSTKSTAFPQAGRAAETQCFCSNIFPRLSCRLQFQLHSHVPFRAVFVRRQWGCCSLGHVLVHQGRHQLQHSLPRCSLHPLRFLAWTGEATAAVQCRNIQFCSKAVVSVRGSSGWARQGFSKIYRLLLDLGVTWELSVVRPRNPEAVTSSRKLPSKGKVSRDKGQLSTHADRK